MIHPDADRPAQTFMDSLAVSIPEPTVDHRGEVRNVYGGPWFAAGRVRSGTTPGADVRWFEMLVPLE
jgi:hypothetical protein